VAILGAIVVGGISAIAGAQEDITENESTVRFQSGPSRLERMADRRSRSALGDFSRFTDAGAGLEDVTAGAQSQRDFATQLEAFLNQGALPSAENITDARSFTSDIFASERVALQQSFQQQEQRTSQLAARLGRSVSDPILQARLAQQQTQQQERLGARETSFAAQEARRIPLQQLQIGQQLASVRQGLASQAFSNRQSLFALGQQALTNERTFRLGAATRNLRTAAGGGAGDSISGGLAGFGGGMGGGGGGGGGGGAAGLASGFTGGS